MSNLKNEIQQLTNTIQNMDNTVDNIKNVEKTYCEDESDLHKRPGYLMSDVNTKVINYTQNKNIRNELEKKIDSLEEQQYKTQGVVIGNKRSRYIDQINTLQDKERLLETRNRMLNIAQTRNQYKQRYIYLLLTIITVMIIIILLLWNYYK
tara:strand:- start:62 stop:514 length:453 start_codon:yes stop_codon:yes gene_type:complete